MYFLQRYCEEVAASQGAEVHTQENFYSCSVTFLFTNYCGVRELRVEGSPPKRARNRTWRNETETQKLPVRTYRVIIFH